MIEVKFKNNSSMILSKNKVQELFGDVLQNVTVRSVPEEEIDLKQIKLRNLQFDNLAGALEAKWKEDA
jgi:hypothetical protein